MSYTNLIIVAGYAGFFATWSNTSKLITPCQAKFSAALMLISLTIFVSWEITKMIMGASINKKFVEVAKCAPEEFNDRMAKIQNEDIMLFSKFASFWPVILILTISTGLVAVGIHIWALLESSFGL